MLAVACHHVEESVVLDLANFPLVEAVVVVVAAVDQASALHGTP